MSDVAGIEPGVPLGLRGQCSACGPSKHHLTPEASEIIALTEIKAEAEDQLIRSMKLHWVPGYSTWRISTDGQENIKKSAEHHQTGFALHTEKVAARFCVPCGNDDARHPSQNAKLRAFAHPIKDASHSPMPTASLWATPIPPRYTAVSSAFVPSRMPHESAPSVTHRAASYVALVVHGQPAVPSNLDSTAHPPALKLSETGQEQSRAAGRLLWHFLEDKANGDQTVLRVVTAGEPVAQSTARDIIKSISKLRSQHASIMSTLSGPEIELTIDERFGLLGDGFPASALEDQKTLTAVISAIDDILCLGHRSDSPRLDICVTSSAFARLAICRVLGVPFEVQSRIILSHGSTSIIDVQDSTSYKLLMCGYSLPSVDVGCRV